MKILVKDRNGTREYDLDAMSRPELVRLKAQLDMDVTLMDQQMKQAEARDDRDAGWWVNVEFAREIKAEQSKAVGQYIGLAESAEDTLPGRFVEAARRRLHPEVFADIMAEARGV